MSPRLKSMLAVLAAGVWITASEFIRNELLLKTVWVDHYADLGLAFPSAPVNGVVWMLWSFGFAGAIYAVSRRFPLLHTFLLAWVVGFVLMWLVIGNMLVLPYSILPYAVPLSLLEAFLASFIIVRLAPPTATS